MNVRPAVAQVNAEGALPSSRTFTTVRGHRAGAAGRRWRTGHGVDHTDGRGRRGDRRGGDVGGVGRRRCAEKPGTVPGPVSIPAGYIAFEIGPDGKPQIARYGENDVPVQQIDLDVSNKCLVRNRSQLAALLDIRALGPSNIDVHYVDSGLGFRKPATAHGAMVGYPAARPWCSRPELASPSSRPSSTSKASSTPTSSTRSMVVRRW